MLSVLAVSAFGFLSLPAVANPNSGDNVNVQTSTQVNTQEGSFNTSVQRTNQKNIDVRQGARGNSGSVQDSLQDSFQNGVGNVNSQNTNQRNVNIRRGR